MKKVLIADDASFMRMMIKNILVKNGCEVVGEAVNGIEAIQKYKSLKPDFVTMDITMPECNGIDAVKEIIQSFPDAKIIMVSAMGQQSIVMDAIRAGAKDFIVKPFNEEKIMESVLKI